MTFNLRYPGQYADKESGLFYNGFRTYIPSIGRYSQSDPIGLDGGWNRFGYVGGNALKFTDPLGLQSGATTLPFPEGGTSIPPWVLTIGGRALGVLGAALSLSGDTECTCNEGYVSIYRVVSPVEFSSIMSTQMYSIAGNPTGAEFKQFWLSPVDADWFQKASLIMDPRSTNTRIVTSKICKSKMSAGTPFTDVGHLAVSFDGASLPMVNRNAKATGGIIPYK